MDEAVTDQSFLAKSQDEREERPVRAFDEGSDDDVVADVAEA
jgi:hypothetical protein